MCKPRQPALAYPVTARDHKYLASLPPFPNQAPPVRNTEFYSNRVRSIAFAAWNAPLRLALLSQSQKVKGLKLKVKIGFVRPKKLCGLAPHTGEASRTRNSASRAASGATLSGSLNATTDEYFPSRGSWCTVRRWPTTSSAQSGIPRGHAARLLW